MLNGRPVGQAYDRSVSPPTRGGQYFVKKDYATGYDNRYDQIYR